MSVLFKLALTLLISYLILVVFVYSFQKNLLFFPTPNPGKPTELGLSDFQEIHLTTSDNVKIAGWYKPAEKSKATILFFHGNGDSISNYLDFFKKLSKSGLGVLAVSYRGYGASEGIPSEQGLYNDAEAAYQFLAGKKIIALGRSLGTGVAVKLANDHHLDGVILISPYTSVVDIAADIYWFLPVRYISKYEFNSFDRINKINTPLLIIHGKLDTLTPLSGAEKLFAQAIQPKKMEIFDKGDHIEMDFDKIASDIIDFANGLN